MVLSFAFWSFAGNLSSKFIWHQPLHAWYLLDPITAISWDFCSGFSLDICSTWPNMDYCCSVTLVNSGMLLHISYRALLKIKLFGHLCSVIIFQCLLRQASSLSIAAFGAAQLCDNCTLSKMHMLHYIGAVSLLKESLIHGSISSRNTGEKCYPWHNVLLCLRSCWSLIQESFSFTWTLFTLW